MQDIIDFETKIAAITIPQEDRRDEEKLYNLMSVEELQDLAPFVSFTRLSIFSLNNIFDFIFR